MSKEDLIGKLEDYKAKVSTLFIHVFKWTSETPGDKYKILLFLLFFIIYYTLPSLYHSRHRKDRKS